MIEKIKNWILNNATKSVVILFAIFFLIALIIPEGSSDGGGGDDGGATANGDAFGIGSTEPLPDTAKTKVGNE